MSTKLLLADKIENYARTILINLLNSYKKGKSFMENSENSLVYIIYACLNTINLVNFAFFILVFTSKTKYFDLAVLTIIVFLIVNIAIYGFFKYLSTKFKWNFWIDFILCNLIAFIYFAVILVCGIAIVAPNLEASNVY